MQGDQSYDAIVVGGGLGGLTSGAFLARHGKRVLVLEQHTVVGGCATTFKRKDLTVEVGLHELDGMDSLDLKPAIFKSLGILDQISTVRVPEFYRIVRGNSLDITIPDGVEGARSVLHGHFPDEKSGIDDFFTFITGLRKELARLPQDPLRMALQLPFFPFLYPRLVEARKKDLLSFLDRTIRSEDLKLVLSANLPYYHDDPATMSLTYFSVAQAGYYQGGGHYIKGGSQVLSDALAGVIVQNGGEVRTNRLVTRIETKNGRARSVSHCNAKKHGDEQMDQAPIIIAGNAIADNLTSLLDREAGDRIEKKTSSMKPSLSLYTLYLGLEGTLQRPGEGAYSTFFYPASMKSITDLRRVGQLPVEERGLVVVDYNKIDSGLAPEGKSLVVLCGIDRVSDWPPRQTKDYTEQKDRMEQILLGKLDTWFPGSAGRVFYSELGTARTVERYTLNPGGAVYGFAQTPENETMMRPSPASPIKGLYIASAWGRPGGGFTGAILSGYIAARKILGKEPLID